MTTSNLFGNRIVASLILSLSLGAIAWIPQSSSFQSTANNTLQDSNAESQSIVVISRSQTVDPETGSVISVSSLKRRQ
ncbi:MAG: hypothetical protein ACFBSC_03255 [Microcoleaceae cyanobacterium]